MRAVTLALFLALIARTPAAAAGPSVGVGATDSLGRRVSLPAPARRIVCLSPGACESLFAMGSGAFVASVTAACDFPKDAAELPKVESSLSPRIEAASILAARPDLVVTMGASQQALEDELLSSHLKIFAYSPTDLTGLARSIMALGALTSNERSSILLASRISESLRRIRTITDSIPTSRKPSVFWLASLDPLTTSGGDTLVQAILDAAGGRNPFIGLLGERAAVSAEEVASRAPAIIVASPLDGGRIDTGRLASLPGWDGLPAIRDSRVFAIPAALLGRGGPRVVTGLLALAKDLHPELFP